MLPATATVCAILAVCTASFAQQGDIAKAEQTFKQALTDEQAGAYDKALGEFTQASELAHKQTPQLLFHLGVCNAKLGHLLAAREELRTAADRAQQEGLENVMTQSKAQLADVQPRIAGITLTRPSQGTLTTVTVDGADATSKVGTLVDVDPGAHAVHVTYADGPPRDVSVKLAEGERRDVAIPPPEVASSAAAAAPAPSTGEESRPAPQVPAEATPAPSGGSTRTVGWILVGGGAALVAGGVVMWILRGNEVSTLDPECGANRQSCPSSAQSDISSGKLYDALGVTGFVAGGAAALAGIGLLVFGGSHADAAAAGSVSVGPMFARGGGGLRVTGDLW